MQAHYGRVTVRVHRLIAGFHVFFSLSPILLLNDAKPENEEKNVTSGLLSAKIMLATALMTAGIGSSFADGELDGRIARARAAAPEAVSAGATIVVDGAVVVEGSNGWTCMPDTMPSDGAAICIDEEWGKMVAAMMAKEPYKASGIGISYMLLGEPPGSGVSNSDPYHENPVHAHDYVETGPHLMVILPKEMLEGISTDPSTGGPYVMWKDTDYAHIMIPVDNGQ